ncbi:MAG TPA: ATP-binding protein [Candidatus Binatia bacterium]|nr:ATP-binding protein [Candidatus Binatia bacterium]
MIRAVSDATAHATPEDWRILRGLAFYRLVLVALELVLYESGMLGLFADRVQARDFYSTAILYAIAALLLLLPITYRRPRVALQAHLHFGVDLAALLLMMYSCGGVSSGFGMLVMTPVVGVSLVLTRRMALLEAAVATLALLGEEILRQYRVEEFDSATFAQTGILGLMFFATGIAANAVALRARTSEAEVARSAGELADLSRLNERVLESMQTGVVVVDLAGRIRLLNAAASQLLRARAGAALELAAPALAAALEQWREGRPVAAAPMAPRPGTEEVVPRFTRLSNRPDASVLILLENARTLREQAQQMKLAALGRLSASIAHEIRNPLSAIAHAGQLLSEAPALSAESQRLLSMIQRQSVRIDKIVRDVLALSRREAPAPGPIALRSWLEQAILQYREAHRASREVRVEDVDARLAIQFDASHLQQVLFNLWDNSFAHGSRDGRRVVVRLSAGRITPGGPLWLDVQDDGIGIAPELLDRMFEPFFTTAHDGTGLGLFLSRELCEYNHARLTYRPQKEGACFRILFTEAARPAAGKAA